MNMWAVSGMPVYPVDRGTRRKGDKKTKMLGLESPPVGGEIVPPAVQPVTSSDDAHHYHDTATTHVDGLLDPAVDGPPSPESIRALSKQMKRASARDKHHSHQTSSSGSSSLRSLTSADRPSWENTLEGRTLSRKSSGRSTSSSMPSRERPDSVQIFGKTIFSRRGRMRRESSAQSSSASSMYSTDATADASIPPPPTSVPSRDSTIPAFFGLRRSTKQDQAGESQRKFSISGPYNFQHVTHTQKDNLPDLQRTNRTVLASEFSQLRVSQAPAARTLKGIKADDLNFADFSSESLPLDQEGGAVVGLPEPQQRNAFTRPHSVLQKSPRRFLSRSQSQEQLSRGIPPPRPPRSPVEQSATPCPPIPPPRISSRTSVRHERFDSVDRPQTSIGCRYTQPFPMLSDPGSPPATSYGYVPGLEMDVIPEHTYTRIMSPPADDANWPLPCPSSATSECTLPNVPEEDESAFVFKKSRASIASNSSLRGSQSVPMLRAFSSRKNDEAAGLSSDGSDAQSRFDLYAAQRALEDALFEANQVESLPRESWEDDIDYCYEHAAEADCDYEWDRPSIETSRDGDSATPVDDQGRIDSCAPSPAMLTPGGFDVPALSPVSQLSSATPQEAITPTVVSNQKASNFSLPRIDSKPLLHARKPSDASSFKESHGFTLSPSLLIPMDYQQQMMACEAEREETSEFPFRQFDEPTLSMDPSALLLRYRTSASTTGTIESTSSAFEKHISTASTSTDFTRLTPSTTSLDIDQYFPKPEPLQRFPSFESNGRTENKGAMPTLPESEEVSAPSTRRRVFRSRGSESNLGRLAMDEPWPGKAKMSIQARRGRARTTSLSTPPPPNQYALFPSVQLTGNRI
ncbi:CRIB domain-containing protein [Madurella fahalii]|uniref:CRIB domain-containing protein n=1 Tax=Madurella fahalii TaxID=1157608 RepID=A0ABQ0GS44_9PEZI